MQMRHQPWLTGDQIDAFVGVLRGDRRLLSFYCMGANQSTQGVDKNTALINLHLLLGGMQIAGCAIHGLSRRELHQVQQQDTQQADVITEYFTAPEDPLARITVEDCTEIVPNRFHLVQMAAIRAKQIKRGSRAMVESENREVVTALREIAAGLIRPDYSLSESEDVESGA